MFIHADVIGNRLAWFKDNQGKKIGGLFQDVNKPYFDLSADDFLLLFRTFSELVDPGTGEAVDALSIYFAVYGNPSDPDVPGGFENKFTFIFSAGKQRSDVPDKATDSGFYYNIAPGNGFDPVASAISAPTFGRWRDNWQKTYLPQLPPDNGGETKSVTYIWENLIGFIGEIQCQAAHGVRIYVVSYTGDGAENFPKRLTTHFALLDARGQEIVVGTNCRPKKLLGGDGFDTGSPCPPAGNCP